MPRGLCVRLVLVEVGEVEDVVEEIVGERDGMRLSRLDRTCIAASRV